MLQGYILYRILLRKHRVPPHERLILDLSLALYTMSFMMRNLDDCNFKTCAMLTERLRD